MRSENSPFEGGSPDTSGQGDDLWKFLSKEISKFLQIIPLRPLQRGNSFQQLFALSLLLFAFTLIFSNCTDNFQALEENDQYYFSMYGYLDASADTQWVRVSPAREQVDAMLEVPDMKVSIENLDTGSLS